MVGFVIVVTKICPSLKSNIFFSVTIFTSPTPIPGDAAKPSTKISPFNPASLTASLSVVTGLD